MKLFLRSSLCKLAKPFHETLQASHLTVLRRTGTFGCLVLLGFASVERAHAADLPLPAVTPPAVVPPPKPFSVRAGFVEGFFDTGVATSIAGSAVTTGNGKISPVPSGSVEAGVFVAPHVAVSVSAGYPPVVSLFGTGSFAPQGVLVKTQTGVVTLTGHYHFDFGAFKPYVGGGVGYAVVLRDYNAALVAPNLMSNAGFVAETGIDYALTDTWGVFVEFKKIWLKQNFTGYTAVPGVAGLAPVYARLRTDPILLTTGVSYRF